jgi:cytochrome oxidase assembly protein ShyY1
VKITVVFKVLGKALAVLTLAAAFLFLGIWQLDRANELQESKKIIPDSTIYQLADLATPATSLDSRNVGKKVQLRGNYILTFRAPNQTDLVDLRSDWEVALMQVDEKSAILVLRGYWNDRLVEPQVAMSTGVDLQALVQPRQFEDVARNASGVISRLDSSVIVSLTDFDLYDGFLLATQEKVSEGPIIRDRIELAPPESKVGGYYWQHISYVVIWWLMAAIVLYLPFYRRGTGAQKAIS